MDLTPEQRIERAQQVREMLAGFGWAHAKALIAEENDALFQAWLAGKADEQAKAGVKALAEFVEKLQRLAKDDEDAMAELEQKRLAQEHKRLELADESRAQAVIDKLNA